MRRTLHAAAALLTLAAAAGTTSLPAASAHGSDGDGSTAVYLVLLRQAPTASYQGDTAGYAATTPATGQRFDDGRRAVATYRTFLLAEQASLLGEVGSPPVLYQYTTALDGFAARLSPSQARTLAASPAVLRVEPDTVVTLDDSRQAAGVKRFTAATTVASAPNPVDGPARAGRGIVIGVVDTGVWPENPSLAGIPVNSAALRRSYPGFTGSCQPGTGWSTGTCGSKVLAAQFFVQGFGVDNVAESDFLSARDASGHGTSVAAVAAGNAGVAAQISGQDLGHISGVAPAAGLSIYKACWTAPEPSHDGCDTADTVAAIDRAVRDGVDVLNYSLGGAPADPAGAVELAFLNAAAAHVSVVASAGNGGPAAGSVQHPSPWVTTVGATNHSVFHGAVRLGDGSTLFGAMLSDKDVATARLISAGDAAAAGVPQRRASLCYPDSLDASKVDGAIVVCERGVTSRVSKGASVDQAGGTAMVLINTRPGTLDADLQRVPAVHLGVAAARQVRAYIARSGASATARLLAGVTDQPALPAVAGFSGRGPASAWEGDLIKPELTAPGVNVVSASSPASASGTLWGVASGTSIAAPQVAGAAAVVRATNPTWSPATVASAMVTTASPPAGATSLAIGAGELNLPAALQPGLAYDSGSDTWTAMLDAQIDPSAANLPSISVGDLVGRQTVQRTVTNVGRATDTYTATVRGVSGVAASVSPSTITVAPGRTATYTVAFTATRQARYDAYTSGSLIWRDDAGHTVTSPLSIRPQLAAVPSAVTASGASGSVTLLALAGVTGTIHVSTSGLVGASPTGLTLHPLGFDPQRPATSDGTALQTVSVPAGSPAARFEVTTQRRGDDVDFYVYRGTTLVDTSTGTARDKTMTLTNPQQGTYSIYVNAFRAARGGVARAVLTSWVLPHDRQPGLDITPRAVGVTGGQQFSVVASWAKLDPRQRWWGYVGYRGLSDVTYLTLD